MKMMEAVKICFQKYADFKGRARRSEYWMFQLFQLLVGVAVVFLTIYTGGMFLLPARILSLVLLIPNLSSGVRRLHDTGRCGWFLLIPIANIVWCCEDSAAGDNEYGPNPKESVSYTETGTGKFSGAGTSGGWTCPSCGAEVEEDAAFCWKCGEPRRKAETVKPDPIPEKPKEKPPEYRPRWKCPECGAEVTPFSNFCSSCGCPKTGRAASAVKTSRDYDPSLWNVKAGFGK